MTEKVTDNQKTILCILFFLLISSISIFWVDSCSVFKSGDSFFSLNNKTDIKRFFGIWDYIFITGKANPLAILKLPYVFIVSLANDYLSLGTIQSINIYVLISISGIFSYLLTIKLFENQHIAGVVTGLFYIINPFAFTIVWRHFQSFIFAYATAPLFLYLLIKYTSSKKNIFFLLAISSSCVIFSVAFLNPAFFVPVIVIYIFYLIFLISRDNVIYLSKKIALLSFIIILTNFWWLLPNLLFVNDTIASAETSGKFLTTYKGASISSEILNSFRLLGDWRFNVSSTKMSFFDWNYNSLNLLLTFIVPFSVLCGLFARTKMKYKRNLLLISVIYLVGLFLSKGHNPPFSFFNSFLMEHIPLFGMFRYNYEKFGLLIVFGSSLMLGFCAYLLLRNLQFRISKSIFLIFIAILFVYNGMPYWTGNLLNPKSTGRPSHIIKVPDYYHKLSEFFKNRDAFFRIASFPPFSETKTACFNWTKGYYGSDPLLEYFVDKPLIFCSEASESNLRKIQLSLVNNLRMNNRKLKSVLNRLGVRYIIIHNDYNYAYKPLTDSIVIFKKRLLNICSKVKTFGKLDVYKLDDVSKKSKIFSSKVISIVNSNVSLINSFSFQDVITPVHTNQFSNMALNDKVNYNTLSLSKINPTTFVITFDRKIHEPIYIFLNETFNSYWKVYPLNNQQPSFGGINTFLNHFNIDKYSFVSFFKEPLPQDRHFIGNVIANSWLLTPKDFHAGNTFVIHLSAQKYFYLGFIFSVTLYIILTLLFVALSFMRMFKKVKSIVLA